MDNNKLLTELKAIDAILKEIYLNQDYNNELTMYIADEATKARSLINKLIKEINDNSN